MRRCSFATRISTVPPFVCWTTTTMTSVSAAVAASRPATRPTPPPPPAPAMRTTRTTTTTTASSTVASPSHSNGRANTLQRRRKAYSPATLLPGKGGDGARGEVAGSDKQHQAAALRSPHGSRAKTTKSTSFGHQRIPNILDGAETLQQRTLKRYLESFGPENYELIATFLPTYGGVTLTPAQIRRLVPPGRRHGTKRKLPATLLSSTNNAWSHKKRPRRTFDEAVSAAGGKTKGGKTKGATTTKPLSSVASLTAATITTRFGRVSKPMVVATKKKTTSRRLPTTRYGRVLKPSVHTTTIPLSK
jgi:hypothetical protein